MAKSNDKLLDDYDYTDAIYRRAEGGYWMEVDDEVVPFDSIKNPKHYTEGRAIQPIEVITDWNLNFNLGNVIKYVSRAGRKNDVPPIEDLMKAKQYLEFELRKYD